MNPFDLDGPLLDAAIHGNAVLTHTELAQLRADLENMRENKERVDRHLQVALGERDEARRVFSRLYRLADHAVSTDSMGCRVIILKAGATEFDLWDSLAAAEASRVRGLESVVEAYHSEWSAPGPQCTCLDAYKRIERDDPNCLYHQSPLTWDALGVALEARREERRDDG